jgi:hypothetical protein
VNKNKKYCYMKTFSQRCEFLLRKFPKWKLLGPETAACSKLLGLLLFILMFGAANTHAAEVKLNFPDLKVPVAGINPVTAGGETSDKLATYTVAWAIDEEGTPGFSGPFALSTVYRVKITLTPLTGNTLPSSENATFTVGGVSTDITQISYDQSNKVLELRFSKTAEPVGTYTGSNLTVEKPKIDEAPATLSTTAIENTAHFRKVSNGSGWEKKSGSNWVAPGDKIAASTVYRAYYKLSAKTGYSFYGAKKEDFKVTGGTATELDITNVANFGTATLYIEFPATDQLVPKDLINAIPIPETLKDMPKIGNWPNFTITGDLKWYISGAGGEEVTGKFQATKTYVAKFTVKEGTTGFSTAGLPTDYFTYTGAKKITYDANTKEVRIEFNETKQIKIAPKLTFTKPVAGEKPQAETAAGTGYKKATITWDPEVTDSKFAAGKEYAAKFTLDAIDGGNYTAAGLKADDITVNIGNVTIGTGGDNGKVIVTFVKTDQTIVITEAKPLDLIPTAGQAAPDKVKGEGYSGAVTWTYTDAFAKQATLATGQPFVANEVYTATITLTLTDNYTLYGLAEDVAVKKNIYNQSSTTSAKINKNIITVVYKPTQEEASQVSQSSAGTVKNIAIAGKTIANDSYKPTFEDASSKQVKKIDEGTVLSWLPNEEGTGGKLLANKEYYVKVAITAEPGFTLKGIKENFFTVEGATRVTHPACISDTIVLTVYVKTEKLITTKELAITAPKAGATPQAKLAATDELKEANITWKNSSGSEVSSNFRPNTVYVATISSLQAKSSEYTLYGLSKDFFTVEAATTTHTAVADENGAKDIKVTFGTTETPVTHLAIKLPTPVAGEIATTTISDPSTDEPKQYDGEVTWKPELSEDGKFLAKTQYSATIKFTPVAGYTFIALNSSTDGVAIKVGDASATAKGNNIYEYQYPSATAELISTTVTVNNGFTPTLGESLPETGDAFKIGTEGNSASVEDISWSPELKGGDKFTNEQYSVSGKIIPKSGRTLYGLTENSFTTSVTGAKVVYNVADSIVTIQFAILNKKVEFTADKPLDLAPTAGQEAPAEVAGEGYTGAITWTYTDSHNQEQTLEAGNPFVAGVKYTATIELTAKRGYTLEGLKANAINIKKDVDGLVSIEHKTLVDNILTVFYKPTPKALAVVSQPNAVKLTGLPEAGITQENFSTSATSEIPPYSQVEKIEEGTNLVWAPSESRVDGKFQANTPYFVKVAVKARTGYTLKGVPANFFTIEGATLVEHPACTSDTIVLTVYVQTGKLITEKALAITAKAGEAPQTKLAKTDELKEAAIKWKYNGSTMTIDASTRFEAGKRYDAEITVNANKGYTLYGLSKNFFTADSVVTNNAVSNNESVNVVIKFKTTETTVTHYGLELPAPRAGVLAPTAISDTATVTKKQYTGVVTWEPALSADGKFLADSTYTATYTLTAEEGYTFYGLEASKFTINSQWTVINHAANAHVFTYKYAKTELSVGGDKAKKVVTVTEGFKPVLGNKVPAITAAFSVANATVRDIKWSPKLPADSIFEHSKIYEVSGKITPSANYTLYGLTESSFIVDDLEDAVATYNASDSLLTIRFAKLDDLITILTIPEIKQPVAGEERITGSETEEYEASVEWFVLKENGSGEEPFSGATFQVGKNYMAIITITPKEGYTVYGLKRNAFSTADGRTIISNPVTDKTAESIEVTVLFATVEGPGTGIDSPQAGDLTAVSVNGTLKISGLTVGEPVSVYTLQGILVSRKVALSTEQEVKLPAGIYIVATGEKRVKALNK